MSTYGLCDTVIYTNGSAKGGTSCGAYAAVVSKGSVQAPQVVLSRGGKGLIFTSSFEMEARALEAAVDYVGSSDVREPVLICSVSQSVLSALAGSRPSLYQEIADLRRSLELCPVDIFLRWVPSHFGLAGNELAD